MPHSISLAASMSLEYSIKVGSHERYLVHLRCLRNIKKIKYPDFQAMTHLFNTVRYIFAFLILFTDTYWLDPFLFIHSTLVTHPSFFIHYSSRSIFLYYVGTINGLTSITRLGVLKM